jgi:hypothetical protein
VTASLTIARESLGQLEDILAIERPFSLFGYIDQSFPGIVPIQRIMSQIRTLGGKTMVVEKVDNARLSRPTHVVIAVIARAFKNPAHEFVVT